MMMNPLIISTMLIASVAWSISCNYPPFILSKTIDDDLVEVKVYNAPLTCIPTDLACDTPPNAIDTLSHVRMMNELVTNFNEANYSGIVSPGATRFTDSLCIKDQCSNDVDIVMNLSPNKEMDLSIDKTLKGDLDLNYTIAFIQDSWGSPSNEKVLFFSDTPPTTLAHFDIRQFVCTNNDLDYLGTPGRFIIRNDTIYQQYQPGLSIPLSTFLKAIEINEITPTLENFKGTIGVKPSSEHFVVSIEGKTLFVGIRSEALKFLNSQPNSKQLRLISTN